MSASPSGVGPLLLLGVYGMELVEAGGALALHAERGGAAHASIMLCSPEMRDDVTAAARVLDVTVGFTDFAYGAVDVDAEARRRLVRVLRAVRPDVVVTQDPEHAVTDLDPDRRQAMVVILEALALAGRDFDDGEGLEPHPAPTLYFMTPSRPDCVVDVSGVWDRKERAMAALRTQLAFSAEHYERTVGVDGLARLVPGYRDLASAEERGLAVQRVVDRAVHTAHGMGHHGRLPFAEAYRREGHFPLDALRP